MKRIKLIVIFFLTVNLPGMAQTMGDFREIIPLPSKDTLVIDRGLGDWWFGINGGFNANYYFSKLMMPFKYPLRDTSIPPEYRDSLITYPAGFGTGYFGGLFAEWNPKGSDWGVSMSLFLQDYRSGIASTVPSKDTTKESYEAVTNFTYVSVSPSARYNFPIQGLYAIGGLDFDFITGSKLINRYKFKNSGDIDHDKKNILEPQSFRLGFHLGIAYEFLVADISHKYRILFSPYLSLNGGTNVITDYGSSRNTFFARLGLSIKLGPDDVRKDTLAFNPNYKPPPDAFAAARREKGPYFGGFEELLVAYEAKPLERSQVSEEIAEKATIDVTEKVTTTPEPQRRITIRPGRTQIYYFPSSASTSIGNDTKEYLDNVAEYLKANPGSRVIIVGHSDDQGTFSQNQKRSEDRAKQVVQYLVSKGISTSRLFPKGQGALMPIAPNNTEEGRKRNRRVEIKIEQ